MSVVIRPISSNEPELRDGVSTSTTSWAEHNVGGSVLQEANVALVMQYVATAKADDMIVVPEVLLTDGTHAVVPVELSHWFSCRWRLWGFSLWVLRLLHRSFPSPCLWLCSASVSLSGAALVLDVLLQVEKHVHVSLLSVIESRGNLHAALVWEARERAGGLPSLPLVEPHGEPA